MRHAPAYLLLLLFGLPVYSQEKKPEQQEIAVKQDGTRVLLKPDGTWVLLKESLPEAKTKNVHGIEESFGVGYWAYRIEGYEWMHFGGHLGTKYLRIEITCGNGDDSASTIPPFYLVDEDGRKYEQSYDRPKDPDYRMFTYFELFERMNPSPPPRTAHILFDVPTKAYWLELSGGYLSPEKAKVRIEPPTDQRLPGHQD